MSLLSGIFRKKSEFQIDQAIEELEEALLVSDAGSETTREIIEQARKKRIKDRNGFRSVLVDIISSYFSDIQDPEAIENRSPPAVVLMFGVNGSGKTTTLAKLAKMLKEKGKTVVLAAGDTFRAAAIEQLEEWSRRIDVPIIRQKQSSDSAAVIHDAIKSAQVQNIQFVLADTAGRMHTNQDLMRELEKINRTVLKLVGEDRIIRLMTIDSQTGQNSFLQVQKFSSQFRIDGVILTKLDSGFKAGSAIRIAKELRIPILYTTQGEQIGDITPFDKGRFVQSLFPESD
jgi:fused signal recognition particle receptor